MSQLFSSKSKGGSCTSTPATLLTMRKRPGDVFNFMEDLGVFEGEMGSLKRIPLINRNQFRLLNQTDSAVSKHLGCLSKQMEENEKNNAVELVRC